LVYDSGKFRCVEALGNADMVTMARALIADPSLPHKAMGGNGVGLETALYLAYQGTISPEVLFFLMANRAESQDTIQSLLNKGNKDITVVEMREKAGQDIGSSTRWTVMAELKRLGVKLMTRTKAKRITPCR